MAKKIQLQTKTSIVDYLKSKGQNASFESRKNLYEKYVGKGYTGTAEQNTQLIKSVDIPSGIKRAASGNTGKLPMSSVEVPGTTPPAVKTTEKPAKKLTANEQVAQSVSSPFRYSNPEVPGTKPPPKEVTASPVKTITAKKVTAPFKLNSPEPPQVKAPKPENTVKTTTAPITTLKGLDHVKIAASVKPDAQGYVDLTHMGFDPLGKDGVRIAEEVSKKYPNARFLCTAGGCAEIANKGATALGYTFNKGNAWEIGNTNQVVYETPKMKAYESQIGTGQPMSDPAGGKQDPHITGLGAGYIIGMNRANNNIPGTGFNKTTAVDSYDYANPDLYPNSRGYEHVGVTLGDKRILHGAGAVAGIHPSYYEISSLDKPFNLGMGNYEAVEAIKGQGAYKQSGGRMKLCKQCGGKIPPLPMFQVGGFSDYNELDPVSVMAHLPYYAEYEKRKKLAESAQITPIHQPLPVPGQIPADTMTRTHGSLEMNVPSQYSGYKPSWVDYLHAGEGAIQYVGGLFNEAHDYRNEKRQLRQGLENIEEDVYDKDKYGLNPASFLMEYGGEIPLMRKGGKNWIKKAVNPKHKGYCTPMTKKTCTPRRKALARTFKKHHGFHKAAQNAGAQLVTTVPQDFKFLRAEGNRKYYNKLTDQTVPVATGSGGGGTAYEQFLQDHLRQGTSPEEMVAKRYISAGQADKYRQYYNPSEQVVYTETGAAPASAPAKAFEGEPIYSGNVLAGLLGYPSRNSANAADAGSLNTGYTNPQFMYVEPNSSRPDTSRGTYDIPADVWNKQVGPNRHLTPAQFQMIGQYRTPSKKHGGLSSSKAKKMLRDDTAHGKKLTAKQKRYFGFIAGGGHPRKQNAGLPEVYGAPDDNPEVWAETGEAARMQDGSIVRVAANGTYNYDHGESAKMPGTPINGAESFLEATSTKQGRTAMADRLLKVDRDTAEQLTGYRPKRPLSHATLLDQSTEHYGKLKKKMLKRLDLQLGRGLESEASRNSVMMNMDFIGNIPTTNQLYDSLFAHQEGVKQAHAIPDEPTSEQKSQYDVKYKYGGKRMAQNALSYVNNIVNQGNTLVRGSGKARSTKKPGRIRSVTRATGRNSGSLFGPEYTHLLQDYPEMFQLSAEAQQALPQLYDIPQSKRSSGLYGEKDWNMDDFKKRHDWYFNSRPDWNASNPNDVKDFQTQYNRHARIYTGKDYFVGAGEKGIDTKFGEYTYNAPGLNQPQIVKRPPLSLTPGAPPVTIDKTPNLQIGFPPDTPTGTTTPTDETTTADSKQPPPNFPLQYEDIASSRAAYLNAMNRDPETMLNTYLPRVQYKTTDPTRALREIDLSANAAMMNAPGGTQGMGFKSQLLANVSKQKADVASQYENANTAILNHQEDVNMGNKGQEAQLRTQNVQNFINNYMQSRARASEQKLQATDSYYNTVAKNKMFNRMVRMMDKRDYTITPEGDFKFDSSWRLNGPPAYADNTSKGDSYKGKQVVTLDGETYVIDKTTNQAVPVQGIPAGQTKRKR